MPGIIVMGSSRSNGDTGWVVEHLAQALEYDVLDLKSLDFSDYDYASNNLDDDFLPAVRSLVEKYDHIVWATPVYWFINPATQDHAFRNKYEHYIKA